MRCLEHCKRKRRIVIFFTDQPSVVRQFLLLWVQTIGGWLGKHVNGEHVISYLIGSGTYFTSQSLFDRTVFLHFSRTERFCVILSSIRIEECHQQCFQFPSEVSSEIYKRSWWTREWDQNVTYPRTMVILILWRQTVYRFSTLINYHI